VNPFRFARLPLIIFGGGRISELAAIVRESGNIMLLVTGASSFTGSANAGNIFGQFREKGINVHHITVTGEPSPEVVDEAVMRFRGKKPDTVVSIGGGSVIDAGKAISAMLKTPGSVA